MSEVAGAPEGKRPVVKWADSPARRLPALPFARRAFTGVLVHADARVGLALDASRTCAGITSANVGAVERR
jgi:hypothetical protein